MRADTGSTLLPLSARRSFSLWLGAEGAHGSTQEDGFSPRRAGLERGAHIQGRKPAPASRSTVSHTARHARPRVEGPVLHGSPATEQGLPSLGYVCTYVCPHKVGCVPVFVFEKQDIKERQGCVVSCERENAVRAGGVLKPEWVGTRGQWE